MSKKMTLKTLARGSLIAANRIASVLDRPFYRKSSRTTETLFIVGLPRSGTTLAYELVAQAFNVAYFSKVYNYTFGLPHLTTRLTARFGRRPLPKFESDYGSIPGLFAPAEHHHFWRTWFPEHPRLGHYVPAAAMPQSDITRLNRTLASLGEIVGLPFVFKDVYLTLAVDAILRNVRGSRVLVISRESDAVAASVYRKRSQFPDPGDWWSIRPPLADTLATSDLPEQVAFQCIRSRQLLDQQLAHADPDRYRVVDYRDVCTSPQAFIDNLRTWLGTGFEARDGFLVPERFENRPSVGFPEDIAGAYAEAESRFESDGDAYLARVQRLAAADQPSAAAGPAERDP